MPSHRSLITLLILFFAACSDRSPPSPQPAAQVVPMACGGACTTSTQCGQLGSCNYCYLGTCSATLPAAPVDAGVDAPPAAPGPRIAADR